MAFSVITNLQMELFEALLGNVILIIITLISHHHQSHLAEVLADELLRGPDEAGRGHHGHGGQLAGDLPQPRHQLAVSLGRSGGWGGATAARLTWPVNLLSSAVRQLSDRNLSPHVSFSASRLGVLLSTAQLCYLSAVT